jgi:sugar (pentulose or hexulose) kinase
MNNFPRASNEGSPDVPVAPTLAVFDFGKTNAKLLVFDARGAMLLERRTQARWRVQDGLSVLDDVALFAWMTDVLAESAVEFGVRHVMATTHGCTFALLDETGLAAPILDYEQPVPEAVERAFDALRPPFAETATPDLPVGFAFGKHIVWREMRDPTLAARTRCILAYAQFWTWRMCGARVSEVSSLGCHTHLWSPSRDDFSSLVAARGWRIKLPPFESAGAVVGSMTLRLADSQSVEIAVHNGVHDSNASLVHYRAAVPGAMTLLSTGTWVIVMNPSCPLDALDPTRDMLANVSVTHEPIPTARFMGGREFDAIRSGAPFEVTTDGIADVIERGIFALPSFADGGPFPGERGAFVDWAGEPVEVGDADRMPLAVLYVASMMNVTLDLLLSDGPIVMDGGLARVGLIPRLLASLRIGQRVLVGDHAEGTACGAAALAYAALELHPFQHIPVHEVEPAGLSRWRAYDKRWRVLADQKSQPPPGYAKFAGVAGAGPVSSGQCRYP